MYFETTRLARANKQIDHANFLTESGDRAYYMGDVTCAGGYWAQALKHLDMACEQHPSAIVRWHELNLIRETNYMIGA